MKAKTAGRLDTKSTGLKIRKKIQMGAYSLGNSFETVGKKLQKNGYSMFGARVKRMGDLIEHIGDQNNKKMAKERNL